MKWHIKALRSYLACGVITMCIGAYLRIKKENTIFVDTENWRDSYLINGWQIILMGLLIVIPGIFFFRKIAKEKDEYTSECTSVRRNRRCHLLFNQAHKK